VTVYVFVCIYLLICLVLCLVSAKPCSGGPVVFSSSGPLCTLPYMPCPHGLHSRSSGAVYLGGYDSEEQAAL
jgi:hypothetical protein